VGESERRVDARDARAVDGPAIRERPAHRAGDRDLRRRGRAKAESPALAQRGVDFSGNAWRSTDDRFRPLILQLPTQSQKKEVIRVSGLLIS
jgi:hypothetical protein